MKPMSLQQCENFFKSMHFVNYEENDTAVIKMYPDAIKNKIENYLTLLIYVQDNVKNNFELYIENCIIDNLVILCYNKSDVKINLTFKNSKIEYLAVTTLSNLGNIFIEDCFISILEFNNYVNSLNINEFYFRSGVINSLEFGVFNKNGYITRKSSFRYNASQIGITHFYFNKSDASIKSIVPSVNVECHNHVSMKTQIDILNYIESPVCKITLLKNLGFEITDEGVIVYKVFNKIFKSPKDWVIEEHSVIRHITDNDNIDCSFGINVATKRWIRDNMNRSPRVWVGLIPNEYINYILIPNYSYGKIRTSYLKLLRSIKYSEL